ncbi:MAG: prepilin-type N-terminal cleavage/methylation domain-containing protein [Pirellulaceae bacterium]|nr:MAG: prepilin-type N-terminal cleavage/methylation domain-containing protein [Pirellulaceae bacterium]
MARHGLSLVELLVAATIIGLVAALVLPGVQAARESARRTQCANNLKQIGLALHLFESSHRVFPASGWTTAGPGNPAGKYVGWRALVLPFLEQVPVEMQYDFQQHWWEEHNLHVGRIPLPIFLCPSVGGRLAVTSVVAKPPRPALLLSQPPAATDYEALMGVQPASINPHLNRPFYNASNRFAVMHRNSRTRFADILDGATGTLMVLEAAGRPTVFRAGKPQLHLANDQGIGWIDSEGGFSLDGSSADGAIEGGGPAAGSFFAMNRRNDNEPYAMHPGGIYVVFADGRVQFVSESISLLTFAALATRAGGEAPIDIVP